jgi:hypothetical protein
MMMIAALLAVLTVIPVIALTQTYGELPVMSQSNLHVYAEQAARSGLQLFESAVDQDPGLLQAFPKSSALVGAASCPTDSGASWTSVTTADVANGQPSEEVMVAVDPPRGSNGLATVYAEGRAGHSGHWTCTEQKLTTYVAGPVLDGPSPGTWQSYQVPTWANAVYASLGGANGLGCSTWPGDSDGGCSYSAGHVQPGGGAGSAFLASLPLPAAGGSIGIGVGAVPTSPFDPDNGQYGEGGATLWEQASGSGLWDWLRRFFGNDVKNLMASFPGGGATMVYWCPGTTCTPGASGAVPLAVAGGGGGSGSNGSSSSLLSSTLLPGGDGGAAGGQSISDFGLSGPGSWASCASGCTANGHDGAAGSGVILLGGGGGGGAGGASGHLAGGSAAPPASCPGGLPFGLGNSTIYFSGGGGGGGYDGGAQGDPGSTYNNFFDCATIAGSGGGGGGSSYVEPTSMIMPSSVKPNPDGSGNGYAQLWFTTSKPGTPSTPACTHGVLIPASTHASPRTALDVAALVTGASGWTNKNAQGGSGAVLPVLVEVPSDENLVESCDSATGGKGGDTASTPTPASSGGNATVLCLTTGNGNGHDKCQGGATPLVVAGGGGGVGDQGDAGASIKGCAVWCGSSNFLGLITAGFAAGAGGSAGIPSHPGDAGAQAGSGGAQGTLGHGSLSISLFGWKWSPSWSLASSGGGSGGSASSGSELGNPGQGGAAGPSGQVFQWAPWSGYTWLEGGSGGGGGGYGGGGQGGTGGGSFYGTFGTGIGCFWGMCFGFNSNGGWFVPGGGGGGGGSWAGGPDTFAESYGWVNPAPSTSGLTWGGLAQSGGSVTVLGQWPAKTMTGPMVVSSVPVGTSS